MKKTRSAAAVIALLLALALWRLAPRGGFRAPGATGPAGSTGPAAPGPAGVDGPYFSDRDRIADRVIAAVNRTQKSLHAAIYDLTQPDIAAALVEAHRRGVEIRIVADERQAREPHSKIPYLLSRSLAIRLSLGYRGNRSLMHNKFAVFDGKLVETGSFNWTTSAERYNFENAVFISDPAVAARYESEFEGIWAQAH